MGSALESPAALFGAAYRAGRVAELDWACRAAAFTEAVRGGLGPPLTLFVNAELVSLGVPAPRTCARPSSWAGATCGSRRPTSSTPSGPRPSGPTPWSSPRASRPSSTPARPCRRRHHRPGVPVRPPGAAAVGHAAPGEAIPLRNAPPTGNPATPWEVVASARSRAGPPRTCWSRCACSSSTRGWTGRAESPGLLPGGRPVHPGHPEPVRVPGHPGGVHRRPRPRCRPPRWPGSAAPTWPPTTPARRVGPIVIGPRLRPRWSPTTSATPREDIQRPTTWSSPTTASWSSGPPSRCCGAWSPRTDRRHCRS